MREYKETDTHGGRIERRRIQVTSRLKGYTDWPGLEQVCRMERTRIVNGRESIEMAYAITSIKPEKADAEKLLSIWRGHWGIENSLHYVRDVTFREDACRVSKGNGPQILAAFRNIIVSLFHIRREENCAAAIREFTWNPMKTAEVIYGD